ncbi:hypothetical protein GQ457_18G008770 [Hibiscus cannabinus]
MPNDGTNLLEVPGNRLPETGSRDMRILHIRENFQQKPARKRFSRKLKDHRGSRNKVKIKDLKPKRIKDYLECKISQRRILREKPSFITSRHVLNLPPSED